MVINAELSSGKPTTHDTPEIALNDGLLPILKEGANTNTYLDTNR